MFNALYLKTDEVNLGDTKVTTMSTRGDFQLCKFQFHQPLTLLTTGGRPKMPTYSGLQPPSLELWHQKHQRIVQGMVGTHLPTSLLHTPPHLTTGSSLNVHPNLMTLPHILVAGQRGFWLTSLLGKRYEPRSVAYSRVGYPWPPPTVHRN